MWIGYSRLALQIRSGLSASIFAKATRRKDVKDSKGSGTVPSAADVAAAVDESGQAAISPPAPPLANSALSTEDDGNKSRQSTINLVVSTPDRPS